MFKKSFRNLAVAVTLGSSALTFSGTSQAVILGANYFAVSKAAYLGIVLSAAGAGGCLAAGVLKWTDALGCGGTHMSARADQWGSACLGWTACLLGVGGAVVGLTGWIYLGADGTVDGSSDALPQLSDEQIQGFMKLEAAKGLSKADFVAYNSQRAFVNAATVQMLGDKTFEDKADVEAYYKTEVTSDADKLQSVYAEQGISSSVQQVIALVASDIVDSAKRAAEASL